MKKIKRILAALILCVMAVSLAGCAELDEMRDQHAVWGEKGKTILYKEQTYYRLEPSHHALGVWDAKNVVFVTADDVPVLLSQRYGTGMTIGKSGILLECYDWNGNVYYCREDYLESVRKQIAEGPVLSNILYEYWDNEGKAKEYSLKPEEIALIEALLAGVPENTGVERYNIEESYGFSLQRTSADGLFRTDLCEISGNENGISLLVSDSDGLISIYPVPVEQLPAVQKIIEKFTSMDWVDDKLNIEFGDPYSI